MTFQQNVLRVNVQRPETPAERLVTFDRQLLIAKENDVVVEKSLMDLAERQFITVIEIYPVDFCPQRAAYRIHLDMFEPRVGGASSSVEWRLRRG